MVLDAMLYAIASGEGILKVVGEVGSGKTMLCRMLEEQLPDTTEVVYIANPNLTPEDILYAVAFELKLPVRRDTSKLLVMQQLQNHLMNQHAADKKVLVIIEEAQGMPVETLEEIRLFSNLETHRDKLMQIILFGQPELDKNLSLKHIRQLRERITHSFYLPPLSVKQTAEYIEFRLGAAGCPCPKLFTKRAAWLIAKSSGGLTRRVNILADKALLSAFSENVLNLPEKLGPDVPPVVTVRHVYAAIKDSEYSLSFLGRMLSPLRWATLGLGAIALAAGMALLPSSLGVAGSVPFTNLSQQVSTSELAGGMTSKLALIPLNNDAAPTNIPSSVYPSESNRKFAELDPLSNFDQLSDKGSETQLPNLDFESLHLPEFASLVRQRSAATLEWLRDRSEEGYTVQFLSGQMNNLEFAESFLNELADAELIDESYFCMSKVSGDAYWTIKHGNFARLGAASDFISLLPKQLHNYKPFVQNISGVECNSNSFVAALVSE